MLYLRRVFADAGIPVLSFFVSAIIISLLGKPFLNTVVPYTLSHIQKGEVLNLYIPAANGTLTRESLASQYSVYAYMFLGEIHGSIVLREEGTDNWDEATTISGAWRDSFKTFHWVSSSDGNSGIGSFWGQDSGRGIFAGTMTALAHKPAEKCELWTFWAIMGPERHAVDFEKIASDFASKAPPLVTDDMNMPVALTRDCKKPTS